jgi:hypothetical protein
MVKRNPTKWTVFKPTIRRQNPNQGSNDTVWFPQNRRNESLQNPNQSVSTIGPQFTVPKMYCYVLLCFVGVQERYPLILLLGEKRKNNTMICSLFLFLALRLLHYRDLQLVVYDWVKWIIRAVGSSDNNTPR